MAPKFGFFVIMLVAFAFISNLVAQNLAVTDSPQQNNAKTQWWTDARFGMFIHWGIYSAPGRGEWLMYQEHIPFSEYALLADQFNSKFMVQRIDR